MRNPASSDNFPASVLLRDTAVCSCNPMKSGTIVCDPNIHITPPEVDFQSVWFPAKWSLGIVTVSSVLLDSQREKTVCRYLCDECYLSDMPVADHMLGSTLKRILPSNLLSKVILIFQFLPNTGIPRPSESKSMTTHSPFPDLLVSCGDRPIKEWTLYGVGQSSCAPIRITLNTLLSVVASKPWRLRDVLFGFDICAGSDQLRDHFCFSITILLCCPLSTSKMYLISEWEWSSQSTLIGACDHIFGMHVLSFPTIIMSSTSTDKNNYNLRWRLCIPIQRLCPKNFLKCLPEESSQWVTSTTGSSIESQFCGLLDLGNLIQIFV